MSRNLLFLLFLLSIIAISLAKPLPKQAPVTSLSGNWAWKTVPNYQVTQVTNSSLVVSVLSGSSGPYSGTIFPNNTVQVSFGPNCCTGQIQQGGTVIYWSNKTQWKRNQTANATPTPKPLNPQLQGLLTSLDKLKDSIDGLKDEVNSHIFKALDHLEDRGEKKHSQAIQSISSLQNEAENRFDEAKGQIETIQTSLRKN
eukprot:TRINITY_DN2190_c0_g1_i1.p1 TRINITY_DN2190_c0_g1~~TRINITY_DN2190_c0_g1_i1.p1  ORF type:complete len:199 (-),score=64.51 TRINITY_DN2190_c0_g1_i1:82-678(-)